LIKSHHDLPRYGAANLHGDGSCRSGPSCDRIAMIISVGNVRCKTVHNAERWRIEDLASISGSCIHLKSKIHARGTSPVRILGIKTFEHRQRNVSTASFSLPTILAASEWLLTGDTLRCRWRISVFRRFSVPKIDCSNEYKNTRRELSELVILDSLLNCSVEKRKKNTR
jgi:hypothetical protein